jgi:COX assembly protein 1
MNGCMMQFATLEEQDRAREEWFATRDQRRRERELKEEKRKEAEAFHRKWWGLDEHGRRVVKTEGEAGREDDGTTMVELAREVVGKR